jgi:hypothetical protein
MSDPTPEFEETVRLAFARVEPSRVFRGCKVASEGPEMIVRVYSHCTGWEKLIPTPYQVFRFDSASGVLTPPSKEQAVRYSVSNYK